jgi:hypothetical protein
MRPHITLSHSHLALRRARPPAAVVGPYIKPSPLPDGGTEFTIDPSGFHEAFCADLPDAEAAFMAISQRRLSGVAFGEKALTPAWRTRPAWAVLPTADGVIHPDVHRFSYDRMGRQSPSPKERHTW